MVINDIDGLQNIVAFDQVTLAEATGEISQDANRRSWGSQSSLENGSMHKKRFTEKSVMTALVDDGFSLTAHKGAARAELDNQQTPTGIEGKMQSTEHVVDRVTNRRVDGLHTLYSVRWNGYGPSDGT